MKKVIFFSLLFASLASHGQEIQNLDGIDFEKAKEIHDKQSSSMNEAWQKLNNKKAVQGGNWNASNLPTPETKSFNVPKDIHELWKVFGNSFTESDYKIKVFISFSMPQGSIERIIRDANKIPRKNISIVLRGLLDGQNMRQTSQTIANMTKGKNVEVHLDPTAFDKFKIKTVPAVVVYKSDEAFEEACMKNGLDPKFAEQEQIKAFGDVSLEYAISHLLSEQLSNDMKNALLSYQEALKPEI
jgi:type-F conjugative transfer system pilin assembly protein TrbC